MRILLFISFFFFCEIVVAQSSNKLHYKAVLVDTHNDVLSSGVLDGIDISNRVKEGHSDLVRWKEGGLDVQFFSVWTDKRSRNKEGFFKDANQEIDSLMKIIDKNPGKIMLATNYKQVRKGIRKEKIVALIGVEGGHMIEDDMNKLEALAKRGMRYMTLTWNNSTSWATSAMDETSPSPSGEGVLESQRKKGLTEFGKEIVRKMNELHVIIDLSHTGEQTFYDAIATTTKPVLLSHSSVWSICPVFRNVKDDQIKAVAKNGGVICINFYSGFISKEYDQRQTYLNGSFRKQMQDSLLAVSKDSATMKVAWEKFYDGEMQKVRPTLGQMVDHIDYIVKLVGDDYVGIGSDYDGVSSLPIGLEDVTTYPKITEELKRRGYSDLSVKKILGGNVLRVMKANFR